MKTNSALKVMALGLSMAFSTAALAQTSASDLVGTWSMTSNVNISKDGKKVDVFGPNVKGVGIFSSDGRFAVVNLNPDTPKFAANNRAQGTAEENQAAVRGSIALFGTYTVVDKVVHMKVEGSTYPNWSGTEQNRNVISTSADEMRWTFAASIGGGAEIIWKRIK